MSRGFWQKNEYLGMDNPRQLPEPEFWDRVGAEIKANAGFSQSDIEELILYGEAAEEKKFLDAVWNALGDLEDEDRLRGRAADMYATLQTPKFSALYTAARGAAEFARRAQGVSGDCMDEETFTDVTLEKTELELTIDLRRAHII